MRKRVEEGRIAERQRREQGESASEKRVSTATEDATGKPEQSATATTSTSTKVRKPSKNARVTVRRPESEAGDHGNKASVVAMDKDDSHRMRLQSDHHSASANISSQDKQRRSAGEVTSAFILPDITMSGDVENQKLPAGDSLLQHNGKNCTICSNHAVECAGRHDDEHQQAPGFSDHVRENNDGDHTTRPSEPPQVALAKVLQSLKDEHAHIRTSLLPPFLSEYSKLDVSMAKRKRKTLYKKIVAAWRDADLKADQIYSLQDVVEGLKLDGAGVDRMTERDVDSTLQSIGIGASSRPANGGVDYDEEEEDDDDDEEEELPWEGFESTADMTGSRHG